MFVGVLILASAILETVGVALVFPLLKVVTDPPSASSLPIIGDFLTRFSGLAGGANLILIAASAFFVIILCKNLFLILMFFMQNRIVFENEWKTAGKIFQTYLRGPYTDTMSRNSAEMIRNVTVAVNETFKSVLLGFISLAAEGCIVLAICLLLVALQPLAAVSAAFVLGAGVVTFHKVFRKKFEAWGEQDMAATKKLVQSVQEGLHSLKTTKVHGREKYFEDAFNDAKAILFRTSLVTNTVNQTPRLFVETLVLATMVLVIVIASQGSGSDTDIFAILGLFAAAAFRLMPSINRIILAINNIGRGSAALQAIFNDTRQLVMGVGDGHEAKDTEQITEIETVRFDRLSYAYPGSPVPVIEDISFDIKRGESIALVGPSGAGKTTTVDILLGLLPASSGSVLINGHDISTVRNAWRQRLGYVPQTVYVTDDTIRQNVAFGYANEMVDDQNVWEALNLAQLKDFVSGLPNGLYTRLGEHGVRLSGGQQQRIGIARALYHDPEILVFDEATSSLDNETEREINNSIERLSGDKTVIIIAHRLSTVRKCDRLVFLDGGRIKDTGTFEELSARNDTFRNLVELAKL